MLKLVRPPIRLAAFLLMAGASAYLFAIRPWHLRWGATRQEARRRFPGDALVTAPWITATRAILIDAPPEAVWPWIVQMGYRRAGWYSYDRLDNDGVHVHRIIPELQKLKVGDTLLTSPEVGFTVRALTPNHHLVLLLEAPNTRISCVLLLEPRNAAQTRLMIRLRARFGAAPFALTFAALFDFGDFVMMRKMMLGIKARAEKEYRGELDAAEAQWTLPRFPTETPGQSRPTRL